MYDSRNPNILECDRVAILSSIVTLFVTFFSSKGNAENINKKMEENIKAIEKSIKINIDFVEKELKTKVAAEALSKYRQEWITELRDKVTQILSKSSELFGLSSSADELNEEDKNELTPSFDGNKKRQHSKNLFELKEIYNYLDVRISRVVYSIKRKYCNEYA